MYQLSFTVLYLTEISLHFWQNSYTWKIINIFENCIKSDSFRTLSRIRFFLSLSQQRQAPGHFMWWAYCGKSVTVALWEIAEGPPKCLHAFRHVICWVELLYRFSKRLDFDLNRRTLNSIHQTDFWRFQPGVHFNWINFPWSINPEIETIKKGGLWIITGSTHIFHETLMRTYWNKRLLVASELFEPQKKLFGFFKWNSVL